MAGPQVSKRIVALLAGLSAVLAAGARVAEAHDDRAIIDLGVGHGLPGALTVEGRLLEDEGIRPASGSESALDLLRTSFKTFETDEIPDARIAVEAAGARAEAVTDREGIFRARLAPAGPLPARLAFTARVVAGAEGYTTPVARGVLLTYEPGPGLATITDFDDTLARTGVRRPLRMVWRTIFGSARTMRPVAGAAAFLRALAEPRRPVLVLSGGPLNLRRRLYEFLALHRFPLLPLVLKDVGTDPARNLKYKVAEMAELLSTYPQRRFILLGDNGEKDPEVYAAVPRARVAAIYIRDVRGDRPDAARYRTSGAKLVRRWSEAAEDAASRGFLPASAIAAVRADEEAGR